MSSLRPLALIAAALFALSFATAAVVPHDAHDHGPTRTKLPGVWYQPDDHPAHKLFKRGPPNDGVTYPTVGSPAWYAAYPSSTPNPSTLPQAWVNALNAAVSAGKIPNLPQSTPTGGNPAYPNGLDPSSDQVCSTTYKCMKNPEVVWNAPDGVMGLSFDDGPQPASDALYTFLQQNNEHATHFFIGVNILNYPNEFNTAFNVLNDDIAVHTWTHPYMTTLSNLDLLGQFGWTMEIIHNSTGGRLPRFWRPPYGDADNRVVAIAKEVFGLTTIVWNQDTADWSIPSGGTTNAAVQASMTKWLTGPKSPGLIILEHELYNQTVQAFMNAYPLIHSNGWKTMSVAQLDGLGSYQNSFNSTSPVTLVNDILVDSATSSSSSSSSTTSAATNTPPSPSSPTTTASNGGASPSSGAALQQKSGALPQFGTSSSMIIAGLLVILSTFTLC